MTQTNHEMPDPEGTAELNNLLKDDIDERNRKTRHEGRVLRDLTMDRWTEEQAEKGRSVSDFEADVEAIARLQMEYATYFSAEVDGRMTEALLRDACFRAYSQREWLTKRIEQVVNELRVLERDYGGSESQDNTIHAKLDFIARLERQEQLWVVIGEAGQRNYREATGDSWAPPAAKGENATATAAKARMAELLSRHGNRRTG